ncbi:MAG: tRNA threonylcarbamoyladenosine dehydratase [Lachnospiraceae bacterium]|nr:tRNA threonylcarbamoyladenosine dehydratase [Lachnospiraceae bacterium]
MMNDGPFSRTERLIGAAALEKLKNARVAVFGIGGVGGAATEALARAGVGHFLLVDKDVVDITNLNRQIIATVDTIGRPKTEVMKERILSVNPEADVECRQCFFLPENAAEFDLSAFDYIVDAVDTVTAKLCIIEEARKAGVPVISAMGAGNKLDPSAFRVADLYDTSVDPLAKVMRRECRKRGIGALKVVYSTEEPVTPAPQETDGEESSRRKDTPASISFVPNAAGLVLAGAVVRDLIGCGYS